MVPTNARYGCHLSENNPLSTNCNKEGYCYIYFSTRIWLQGKEVIPLERPLIEQQKQIPMSSRIPVEGELKATWRDYVTVTKPGINVSNLLATFAGIWLADPGSLNLLLVVYTLLGTGLIIAGGAVLNNFIDRDIDPIMSRTKERPVAAGRIHPQTALWMGILLGLSGMVLLMVLVNPLTAFLGMIGFFVYVFVYSAWLKRTTPLNTAVGGISGAVPPMMGWTAVTGTLDPAAWVLFLFMFLWQPPHFYALAMRKVEDYRKAGVPMLPVVRGFAITKRQVLLWIIALVPVSILLFATGVVGKIYLTLAIVLGTIYLVLAVSGLFVKDNDVWSRRMFFYSLIYLTCMQLAMFINATGPIV